MQFIHAIASEINSQFEYKISPEKIITDGKTFVRWGKDDHCWGIGNEWVYKTKTYWKFTFASWKGGEPKTITSWSEYETMDKGFYKKLKEENALADFKIEQIRHEKNDECKKTWLPIYENATTNFSHDYLERKKIGKYNSRLSKGQLLIPVYDTSGFVGVQRIWADGTKRFSSGIKMKGSFSFLKDFEQAKTIFICEGFATGATIQDAFPEIPVMLSFSCHNLPAAIESIKTINPNAKIVIAADRDSSGQGEKWAKISQKRHANVIYRLPVFPTASEEYSDFNDLRKMYDLEKVKTDLAFDDSEFATITALGYKGNSYFYKSSENLEIVEIKAREHDRKSFMRLVPDLKYWYKRFGTEVDGQVKVSWELAQSVLMQECKNKKIFDSEMTRGVGIWRDSGQIVINDGAQNNAPTNAEYIYMGSAKKNLDMVPYLGNPLNELWEKGFSRIGSKNKQSNVYLAAWLVQAYIFPLLNWRFNIWLRGPAGLGKTDILKNIKRLIILSEFSIDATAAGVKHKHKSDQIAFLYDEAEPDNHKAMADFMALARQCNSNTGGSILRGSSSGNAIQFNPQVLFALGSIQDSVINAADRSRWLFVDIKKIHLEEWQKIEEFFESFSKRKNELLSYIFDQFDTIQAVIKMAKKILNDRGQDARSSDQLSAVIGCMSIYFMTNKEAQEGDNMEYIINHLIDFYELLNSDYTEDNKVKESENALESLVNLVLDQKSLRTVHDMIYGEICFQASKDSTNNYNNPHTDCAQMLSAIGLRVLPGPNLYGTHEIFIAAKNDLRARMLPRYPKLAQVLKDSKHVSKEKITQRVSRGSAPTTGTMVYYDIRE